MSRRRKVVNINDRALTLGALALDTPPRTPLITQATLKDVARYLRRYVIAKLRYEQATIDYQESSDPVIYDLKNGALVEPGRYKPSLKKESKRYVKWKGVVIEKLGKDEAVRIARETEPTITWKLVLFVPPARRRRREE